MEALAVLAVLVAAGSSAWVFFDAPWHGLPRGWAAACLVFWPVAFPWYLWVRRGGPAPSLNPESPDPYPVDLPRGYRPAAPMVPPPPPSPPRGPAPRGSRAAAWRVCPACGRAVAANADRCVCGEPPDRRERW